MSTRVSALHAVTDLRFPISEISFAPSMTLLSTTSTSLRSQIHISPTTTLITVTKGSSSRPHSRSIERHSSRSRNKIIATGSPSDGSSSDASAGNDGSTSSYNSGVWDPNANNINSGAYESSTNSQAPAALQDSSPSASFDVVPTYPSSTALPSSTVNVFTNSAVAPLVSAASFTPSSPTTYAPLPTLAPLNSTPYNPDTGLNATSNSTPNTSLQINSGPSLPIILIPIFLAFAVIVGAVSYTIWKRRKLRYNRSEEKLLEFGTSAGIAKWWRDREYNTAIGPDTYDRSMFSAAGKKGYETFEQIPSLRKTTSNAAIIHHARAMSQNLNRRPSVLSQHSSQHSSDGSSLGSISIDFCDALGIMPASPTEQEWLASVARRRSSSSKRHRTKTEPDIIPVIRRSSFVLPSAAVPRPFGVAHNRGHVQRPSLSVPSPPVFSPIAEGVESVEATNPFGDPSEAALIHGLGFGTYGQRKRPLTLIDTPDLVDNTVSIVHKQLPATPISLPFDNEADIVEAGSSDGTLSRHHSR